MLPSVGISFTLAGIGMHSAPGLAAEGNLSAAGSRGENLGAEANLGHFGTAPFTVTGNKKSPQKRAFRSVYFYFIEPGEMVGQVSTHVCGLK